MSPTKILSIEVISCVLNLYELLPLPDRAGWVAGSPQSPPIYILPKVDTACDDAFYNGKHPPLKMRKRKRILMILRQKMRKMMNRIMDMWLRMRLRMQDMPN